MTHQFATRTTDHEFVELISHGAHERYMGKLFRRLNCKPSPIGRPRSHKILKADREAGVFMAENVDRKSQCEEAGAGASCKKGWHVCFKANCFKPHAFSSAHSEKMPKESAN